MMLYFSKLSRVLNQFGIKKCRKYTIYTVCCHPTKLKRPTHRQASVKVYTCCTCDALCHEETPLVINRGGSASDYSSLSSSPASGWLDAPRAFVENVSQHPKIHTACVVHMWHSWFSHTSGVCLCVELQFKYAMLVRTLTCAGLLLIFCRVTVSLSDGCDSDSSSPSPPSHNKAPASLRSAHNQVSWSCDAWIFGPSTESGNQCLKFPQGIF